MTTKGMRTIASVTLDEERRCVGCADAVEVGAEDGDDPGLKRFDRGGRDDGYDDEGDVSADEIEKCQVGKIVEVVVGAGIVGVRQHPHDPEPYGEPPPHVPDGPGGPDTLSRTLVELLGAGDGDEQDHGGRQPVGGPVGRRCELLPGEPIGGMRARHDEQDEDQC